MPRSAPGETRPSKAVPGTEDTPREGCVWDVEMCLNAGEDTAQPSPGVWSPAGLKWQTAGPAPGAQAGTTLQDRGRAEWSSHNEGAAPVFQGPDGRQRGERP